MRMPPVGSRAPRRRSCSAKPSRGERHNSVPTIPTRCSRSITSLLSCTSGESLMRPGRRLWVEEKWPFPVPEGKAWMLFCFPLVLDSNIRVMYCPMKRCDKWFIYALCIYLSLLKGCFVLYICLLLFPTPPAYVPAFSINSWKIIHVHHTFKRVHHIWRLLKIRSTSKRVPWRHT